jgi:Arrestin (or S-antigen), C-terminal domain
MEVAGHRLQLEAPAAASPICAACGTHLLGLSRRLRCGHCREYFHKTCVRETMGGDLTQSAQLILEDAQHGGRDALMKSFMGPIPSMLEPIEHLPELNVPVCKGVPVEAPQRTPESRRAPAGPPRAKTRAQLFAERRGKTRRQLETFTIPQTEEESSPFDAVVPKAKIVQSAVGETAQEVEAQVRLLTNGVATVFVYLPEQNSWGLLGPCQYEVGQYQEQFVLSCAGIGHMRSCLRWFVSSHSVGLSKRCVCLGMRTDEIVNLDVALSFEQEADARELYESCFQALVQLGAPAPRLARLEMRLLPEECGAEQIAPEPDNNQPASRQASSGGPKGKDVSTTAKPRGLRQGLERTKSIGVFLGSKKTLFSADSTPTASPASGRLVPSTGGIRKTGSVDFAPPASDPAKSSSQEEASTTTKGRRTSSLGAQRGEKHRPSRSHSEGSPKRHRDPSKKHRPRKSVTTEIEPESPGAGSESPQDPQERRPISGSAEHHRRRSIAEASRPRRQSESATQEEKVRHRSVNARSRGDTVGSSTTTVSSIDSPSSSSPKSSPGTRRSRAESVKRRSRGDSLSTADSSGGASSNSTSPMMSPVSSPAPSRSVEDRIHFMHAKARLKQGRKVEHANNIFLEIYPQDACPGCKLLGRVKLVVETPIPTDAIASIGIAFQGFEKVWCGNSAARQKQYASRQFFAHRVVLWEPNSAEFPDGIVPVGRHRWSFEYELSPRAPPTCAFEDLGMLFYQGRSYIEPRAGREQEVGKVVSPAVFFDVIGTSQVREAELLKEPDPSFGSASTRNDSLHLSAHVKRSHVYFGGEIEVFLKVSNKGSELPRRRVVLIQRVKVTSKKKKQNFPDSKLAIVEEKAEKRPKTGVDNEMMTMKLAIPSPEDVFGLLPSVSGEIFEVSHFLDVRIGKVKHCHVELALDVLDSVWTPEDLREAGFS